MEEEGIVIIPLCAAPGGPSGSSESLDVIFRLVVVARARVLAVASFVSLPVIVVIRVVAGVLIGVHLVLGVVLVELRVSVGSVVDGFVVDD